MSKYKEPNDMKWTRGGSSYKRHAKHRKRYIDEYNDEDPESYKWPNKLEPSNLHPLDGKYRNNRRNEKRHMGECTESCDCDSEPLEEFNIENDYRRK
jgi:hypothetical protein